MRLQFCRVTNLIPSTKYQFKGGRGRVVTGTRNGAGGGGHPRECPQVAIFSAAPSTAQAQSQPSKRGFRAFPFSSHFFSPPTPPTPHSSARSPPLQRGRLFGGLRRGLPGQHTRQGEADCGLQGPARNRRAPSVAPSPRLGLLSVRSSAASPAPVSTARFPVQRRSAVGPTPGA